LVLMLAQDQGDVQVAIAERSSTSSVEAASIGAPSSPASVQHQAICSLRLRYSAFRVQHQKKAAIIETTLWLAAYYTVGIAFYSTVEGWSWLESAYFLTVTMSTVGYGDFHPSEWHSQAATLFFIIVGIVGVFSKVSLAAEQFISPVLAKATVLVKVYVPDKRKIRLDGDSSGTEYPIPRSAFIYYGTNLVAGLTLLLLLQLGFAGLFVWAFSYGESGQPRESYGVMLYHSYVTMTTVGYGDISVSHLDATMAVAIAQILVTVSLMASLLSQFNLLGIRRHEDLKKLQQLTRRLDPQYMRAIAEISRSSRPAQMGPSTQPTTENEWSLSRLDFVVGTLLLTKVLKLEDVEPVLRQFDALDTDGSGRLGPAELRRHEEHLRKRAFHKQLSDQALLLGATPRMPLRGGRTEAGVRKLFAFTSKRAPLRTSSRSRTEQVPKGHTGRRTQVDHARQAANVVPCNESDIAT
jgi:voltage-gated potassium channel Kch